MSQRVRFQVKNQINAAVAAGTQPKAPRSGLGLVLPTGARFRTLYGKKGLTAAGKYYYEKLGVPPPGKFGFQQDAARKGRSRFPGWGGVAQRKRVEAFFPGCGRAARKGRSLFQG